MDRPAEILPSVIANSGRMPGGPAGLTEGAGVAWGMGMARAIPTAARTRVKVLPYMLSGGGGERKRGRWGERKRRGLEKTEEMTGK